MVKYVYYKSTEYQHVYRAIDSCFAPYHKADIPSTKKEWIAYEQGTLREFLEGITTIWTKITHVSRSGMSRRVALYVVKDGEICDISTWAGTCADLQLRDGDIVIGGCGFHVGQQTVENLSYALFGNADHFQYRDM